MNIHKRISTLTIENEFSFRRYRNYSGKVHDNHHLFFGNAPELHLRIPRSIHDFCNTFLHIACFIGSVDRQGQSLRTFSLTRFILPKKHQAVGVASLDPAKSMGSRSYAQTQYFLLDETESILLSSPMHQSPEPRLRKTTRSRNLLVPVSRLSAAVIRSSNVPAIQKLA